MNLPEFGQVSSGRLHHVLLVSLLLWCIAACGWWELETGVPEQPPLHVLPIPARTTHDPIAIALAEDIGRGDLTSRYFVGVERRTARLFAKQPAVAAGVETAGEVFRRVDPQLEISVVRASGSRLESGQTVIEVAGSVRSILTAERVALNFLQQLSGVATMTRRYVDAVVGTKARILDTRKTTPGLRALEKAAVVAGGGTNHRFGLFDMVLVKDNHLAAETELAHLQEAIRRCRTENPTLRIEIEADARSTRCRRFLTLMGVDVILLDNMTARGTHGVRCSFAAGRVQLEASGGVTLETVAAIAATGVDFISVGALTPLCPGDRLLAGTHMRAAVSPAMNAPSTRGFSPLCALRRCISPPPISPANWPRPWARSKRASRNCAGQDSRSKNAPASASGCSARPTVSSPTTSSPDLGPCALIREILVFNETSSTNDYATQRGFGRAPPGGVAVFAERQTAGRGRFGRSWASASHRGLWFSLLLRPTMPIQFWLPPRPTWTAAALARERSKTPSACR